MHSDPNYIHVTAHLQDLEQQYAFSRRDSASGTRRRLRDMPLAGMLVMVALTSTGLMLSGL
jgi:hypothetical protein